MKDLKKLETSAEKELRSDAKRALVVAARLICPDTDISVKRHEDLGFLWKLIYWATLIITFGQVKMTNYAFVLSESMFVRNASTTRAELVFHEAIHMRQREKSKLIWYINYLFVLPTLFTMRAFYERDAYTVSSIMNGLNRATDFSKRHDRNPFSEVLFARVLRYTYIDIDWYVEHEFFGFGYFFMALFRKSIKAKMRSNAIATLSMLFGDSEYKYTNENNRFLDETNIVDAIRAFYK